MAGNVPMGRDRFLLDAMLGSLARYLRMCGYDAAYALDRDREADADLLALARAEDRVLITRDRQLAGQTDRVILLTERDVVDQLRQLAAAGIELTLPAVPNRCGSCNGQLEAVPADASIPEYVPEAYRAGFTDDWEGEFDDSQRDRNRTETAADLRRCPDCGQFFWMGSHWDDVEATLAEIED